MNSWRSRILTALVFLVVMNVHTYVTMDLENSPIGMLVFHGSAALCDLFLLYSLPSLIDGRLCDFMETSCLVSIVANFIGWLLYLAYAPPVFYNTFLWGLSYVQLARLLLVDDDHVTTLWGSVVRRADYQRA